MDFIHKSDLKYALDKLDGSTIETGEDSCRIKVNLFNVYNPIFFFCRFAVISIAAATAAVVAIVIDVEDAVLAEVGQGIDRRHQFQD